MNHRKRLPKKLISAILERDSYTCNYCCYNNGFYEYIILDGDHPEKANQIHYFYENPKNLEVDHIIPVHLGGNDEMSNLQTLCIDCHRRKSAFELCQRKLKTRINTSNQCHSSGAIPPMKTEQYHNNLFETQFKLSTGGLSL